MKTNGDSGGKSSSSDRLIKVEQGVNHDRQSGQFSGGSFLADRSCSSLQQQFRPLRVSSVVCKLLVQQIDQRIRFNF